MNHFKVYQCTTCYDLFDKWIQAHKHRTTKHKEQSDIEECITTVK